MKLAVPGDISELDGEFDTPTVQEAGVGHRWRPKPGRRWTILLAVTATIFTLSACGSSDKKTYDISPIFPFTSNKCAKYDGEVEGTGPLSYCWVTKSQCERAVTDWHQATQGIQDAIEFRC